MADMGQNMVGWVRLAVEGPAGTTVTLRHAEVLDKDGNFYTANLRKARATVQYTLRGGSRETEVSEFTIKPAGSPSGAAVTNATPVANLPSASRNERASPAAGAGAASAISVKRRLFAEGDVAEVVVGAVGAERVHEGAGLDVAVRARERAAVHVAIRQLR